MFGDLVRDLFNKSLVFFFKDRYKNVTGIIHKGCVKNPYLLYFLDNSLIFYIFSRKILDANSPMF